MEIISLINEGMAVLPTLCPSLDHLDVLFSGSVRIKNSKIIKG